MPSDAFLKFWHTDLTRDCFLSYAAEDLKTLRLVSHDFATQAAPLLFTDTQISFTVNTFSRQARLAAFERIGHHIKKLTFHMPHDGQTFLPPLLDPVTGTEQPFIYQPCVSLSRPSSVASRSSCPRYGSLELNDLLIKHYPPLFHAATNIPSFIRALSAVPNLRHLHVSCPEQLPNHRYRRSVVDYALISLRMAVEQVNPSNLTTLTLSPIHPSALLHLRPISSIGSSPASTRVWRRITKLEIAMPAFPFARSDPSDHIKVLHTYLAAFGSLERLHFTWLGLKGPSPLSLELEPCTSRPTSLDCSMACPLTSAKPSCRALKFRKLRSMRLENAILDAHQAATFIMSHRKILHEFEFEHCDLRSGTWDDALAPLTRISGSDDWKQKQHEAAERKEEEVMDVPIVLNQVLSRREMESVGDKLWDSDHKRSRGLQVWRKVSLRTKEMLGLCSVGSPGGGNVSGAEQVRRLLRGSVVRWH